MERNARLHSYIQNNVKFVFSYKTGNSAPVVLNPGLVRIKTSKSINEGDEIYLFYGKRMIFHE